MKPPPPGPALDPTVMKARMAEIHSGHLNRVETLADALDAEYVFQALVTAQMLTLNEGFKESEHGNIPAFVELAAFHLYPKFGKSSVRDADKVQALIDALTALNDFRGVHTAFEVDPKDRELAELQVHLRLFAETVRGSAYGPQIHRLIEEIQGPFETWFRTKVGIGPRRALQVVAAFEEAVQDNYQSHGNRMRVLRTRMEHLMARIATNETGADAKNEIAHEQATIAGEMTKFLAEAPLVLPCSFDQLVAKIPDFTRAEWDGLRELVGLTPAARATLQRARDVKDRPCYFLSNDRLMLLGTSIYDALFDAFDRTTRTDLPFRDKRYVPHLSGWVEHEAVSYFVRLFPPSAVYRQLTYPDPDHPGGEAELDLAVLWGPFLLVVEVKGKQFRPRSRLGDPARLRDDLKDNIEEAFEQATRATRYLNAGPTATFKEKESDRKLVVQTDTLRRIFPLSVTLHHFASLTTQLALLKRIGLFKDSAYPWSVSLADLDVITKFAGTPDVFLHYVQRRLDLQRSEKNVHGDELDLFGLYLDTRLHPAQFWDRKEKDGRDFTMLHLTGGSERFDDWYRADDDPRFEKPDIKLDLPSRVGAVIERLRQGTDDGSRWIAFALLGLSSEAIAKLDHDLERMREQECPPGKFIRVTSKDGDVVVSLVGSPAASPTALHRQAVVRASMEKYRLKASASLALGLDLRDPSKPYDCAAWVEGPWEFDPLMEEAIATERPRAVSRQRMPGRNDPCVCGSGKKFKKCCLGKIKILPE